MYFLGEYMNDVLSYCFRIFAYSTLALVISACGGGGSSNTSISPPPSPPPTTNSAPVISNTSSSIDVYENSSNVLQISATDTDNDTLSFQLSGEDASLFNISNSGYLTFNVAPDFEQPNDADFNNSYEIIVTVSDGRLSDVIDLSVVVKDVIESDSVTISGRVIDGYISGATAFLDLNFNAALDVGEPNAISNAEGLFDLILNNAQLQCSAYVPLVVDVPVGALDAELGEVSQAYQLILAPKEQPLSAESIANVTPLTSVIWNEVKSQLLESLTGLNCDSLQQQPEKIALIRETTHTALLDTVLSYGLTSDQVFADYIATNDAMAKNKAQQIVPALQLSYAATTSLNKQIPRAEWAFINLFKNEPNGGGDKRFPEAWLKRESYKLGDLAITRVFQLSDDLSTNITSLYLSESEYTKQGQFSIHREREYQPMVNSSLFSCSDTEQLSVSVGSLEVKLQNRSTKSDAASVNECGFRSFAESTDTRYITTSNFQSDGTEYSSQFVFNVAADGFNGLETWVDLIQTQSLDAQPFLRYISGLPYDFCATGKSGAGFVNRSKSSTEGDVSVVIDRADDWSYSVTNNYPDGRVVKTDYTASENTDLNGCAAIIVDLDGDGIPNSKDLDDDGDGFPDSSDAFPLIAAEWRDTDGDGIGDNADSDDDGDGVADASDDYPLDAANFTDSDNDGVYDFFDVQPNDGSITKAVVFDLDEVDQAGISEANLSSGAERIVFNDTLPSQQTIDRLVSFFVPRLVASDNYITLTDATNLVSWNSEGVVIDSVVLSDETMFVAEAVLSPNGKQLYMITSPETQRALNNNGAAWQVDSCELYRVHLDDNNRFECVLNAGEIDISPIVNSIMWRDDYMRKAMDFRADGTAVFVSTQGGYVLHTDGSIKQITTPRTAPAGFVKDANKTIFWLDDEHVAVTFSIFPEGGGASTSYWAAINIETGEEVDEISFGDFRIVRHNNQFLSEDGTLVWNGSKFLQGNAVGSPVQDSFGNLWAKDNVYGLSMTDSQRGITVHLGEEGTQGPNIYMESGAGTGIRYRDFAFAENWVLHKYSKRSKDTVISLQGAAYDANQRLYVDMPSPAGSLIKLYHPDLWYYVRSGNETGDVTINYQVTTVSGKTEQRSYVLPFEAIQNMALFDSNIYDPAQYATGYGLLEAKGEGIAIEIPNPEAERQTFCLYSIDDDVQRCAELADYSVLSTDIENIRNNVTRLFPSNRFACPDGSCSAVPGVHNVIIAGKRFNAYFKDSVDNTFYKAEAELEDFMLNGDAALSFSVVKNGEGESEIIAAANQVIAKSEAKLENVLLAVNGRTITIDFGQPLNNYAPLPNISVLNPQGKTLPLITEPQWQGRQKVIFSVTNEHVVGEKHTVNINDFLFLPNSALRYSLADELSFVAEPSKSFEIKTTQAITVVDFNPATQNASLVKGIMQLAGTTLTLDFSDGRFSLNNLTNAVNGGVAQELELTIPLDSLPVINQTDRLLLQIFDGDDAIQDAGERFASLAIDYNIETTATSVTFDIPSQTLEGVFVASSGEEQSIVLENASLELFSMSIDDELQASFNLSLQQLFVALKGVDFLKPGSYVAKLTTNLPITSAVGESINEIVIQFNVGE